MERLKLSDGLVAIGYGAFINNIDQTKLALILANKLAKKENVLFLNWNNYFNKLERIFTDLGIKKSENLEINTDVSYFGLSSFLDIAELIEKFYFSTIFIDNVLSFTSGKAKNYEDRDLLIKSLKFITERYSVRIVFNVAIDADVFSYSSFGDENVIELGYFRWSRRIINDCEQVIAIQNIAGELDGEIGERYELDTYKIYNLKNREDKIESHIITL
jgi:hypothetical protein